MKYYKLKKNNACIVNSEEFFINKDDAYKKYKGGFFNTIGTFKEYKCKSIQELKQEILKRYFAEDIDDEVFYPLALKLVDEIIEKVGVETFEINYPDQPCIIVKCETLGDQFECDANRIPFHYLQSAKEIETSNFGFYFEVWLINKDGSIKLNKDLGTY